MHKLKELKEMLMRELEESTKHGELSAGSLDIIDKLTHSIKSIDTIIAMDESGYSNEGSYARGRSYARRDSMGRYARRGSYDSYGRGGSYDYSREEAKDELLEELRSLQEGAKDEESRQMISEWIRQMER